MRILFIAPSAYLLGGVQDWLYMLVLGLRDRGHQVVVGVPDGKFHRLNPYNQHFAGLNAKGFVNRTGTQAGAQRALGNFLIDNPADLVIGVNIADLYGAFAARASKLFPAKLIMTLHAIEADYFADIEMYASVLDAIVVTNRLTEALVKGIKPVHENRVFYAPYGVASGPTRISRGSHPLRIAWVGRIENSQKRAADLRPILLNLDEAQCDYRVSIAGSGPDLDELRNLLAPWIQSDKVKLEGVIAKANIQDFLAGHDVLLITSQWETGPIVAWEAMAAGLVVVSSDYVGSYLERALIHDSTALLYPIGDAQEACRQMMRLNDDLLYQSLSVNGRRMALSRYSIGASIDAWEQAFEQTLQLDRQVSSLRQPRKSVQPSGRLERFCGPVWAERLRRVLPLRTLVPDSGSEWPHSMHHIQDQTAILESARSLEAATAKPEISAP
ncbi:MAG: glycosyltransferase family 4 protein [Synechococcaceae cyanobacterium]|nr:glycosyltransferase family 4 protein [Synechococcaceae cyanobacterium]